MAATSPIKGCSHENMQYFAWYLSDDGKHWQRLTEDGRPRHQQSMASAGLKAATGTNDAGYGIYAFMT
ncbi:hypothetical protein [Neisseria iguanae]|uniref:hypothetical protein n=1 Tax=Neisseria iguanae TaxID=90242 RepID=UPI001B80E323|nr:hypothetical protein [Neisseria iguanae]